LVSNCASLYVDRHSDGVNLVRLLSESDRSTSRLETPKSTHRSLLSHSSSTHVCWW